MILVHYCIYSNIGIWTKYRPRLDCPLCESCQQSNVTRSIIANTKTRKRIPLTTLDGTPSMGLTPGWPLSSHHWIGPYPLYNGAKEGECAKQIAKERTHHMTSEFAFCFRLLIMFCEYVFVVLRVQWIHRMLNNHLHIKKYCEELHVYKFMSSNTKERWVHDRQWPFFNVVWCWLSSHLEYTRWNCSYCIVRWFSCTGRKPRWRRSQSKFKFATRMKRTPRGSKVAARQPRRTSSILSM